MADWDDTTNIADFVPAVDVQERDRAFLIVLTGTSVGEMYKVSDAGVTIGRGRNADIQLLDDGISRLHCELRVEDGNVVVRDLASRNGTFCNGERVRNRPLADGDKIQVGRTTILKFTYHDDLDESFSRQMYESALRDGLTRAFNKRYFHDRLESELRFAKRHGAPLSLVLLDLDHFKEINDEHGHLAGDQVLADVARRIHNTIRTEDVFARYGGEEFAVICRGTSPANAHTFAERLRRGIEDLKVTHESTVISVTISAGVAGLPDTRADTPEALIAAADGALYEAKAAGRNRIVRK